MINLAIFNLYPTVTQVKEREGTWSAQTDDDVVVTLDMVAVEAKAAELETATRYQINRREAYNALNQLELLSDDAINGTTTYADAITAIKVEFPKP